MEVRDVARCKEIIAEQSKQPASYLLLHKSAAHRHFDASYSPLHLGDERSSLLRGKKSV